MHDNSSYNRMHAVYLQLAVHYAWNIDCVCYYKTGIAVMEYSTWSLFVCEVGKCDTMKVEIRIHPLK